VLWVRTMGPKTYWNLLSPAYKRQVRAVHTHTHAHTHTCARTHTHTHTHTPGRAIGGIRWAEGR
jgi:ABC-type nickel/cobalt efflux system permease component RcnA